MSEKRGQWGSRMGFVVAAIGSAIGLGNIWRFPYVAASNGGGAFLIPYLFALFTAGIPILILEFAIAHKIKSSTPGILGRLSRKMELLGWFQTAIAFGIVVYYTAIIGWTVNYTKYAATGAWGTDTGGFFKNTFLHLTDGPGDMSSINSHMLIALVVVWLVNFLVLMGGIKSGIEKANKIFMPLLIICLLVIVIRGLTLEGAAAGLDYFFKPDFKKLLEPSVWIGAYGQIFYSLSICFGIMLTYASYLPKKSDLVNSAFMTGLGNCSFSILSGIGVFSIIGYMAATQGAPVAEVAGNGGIGLAFVVFPMAINALVGMNGIVGVVFFLCLIFAGFSSSMSVLEVIVSSISDKFALSRRQTLPIVSLLGFVFSLLFVTDAGLHILDIVDHYINTYAIAISGLVEVIFISWFMNLDEIRGYANELSDFGVGRWWNYTLKFLTPLLLAVMFIMNVFTDITTRYSGYDLMSLMLIGFGCLLLLFILSIAFTRIKGRPEYESMIGKGVKM